MRKFRIINNLKVVMTVVALRLRARESSVQNSQSSFRFGILRRIVCISASRLSHSFHFATVDTVYAVTGYTYTPGAFSIDEGITNVSEDYSLNTPDRIRCSTAPTIVRCFVGGIGSDV